MDGGMVALLPADPGKLTVPSGDPADQLHLTLHYLGGDVTNWEPTRRQLLCEAVRSAAMTIGEPIQAWVMGHATFNPDGGPDGDRDPCAVHLIGDTDRLAPIRSMLGITLTQLLGDDYPAQHEPFLPHTTAGEGLTAADLTYTGPIVFDRLVLALAGEWTEFPLTQDPIREAIRPFARVAYAHGWSRSEGPMTDQVKAGCIAAVDLAADHAHHPGVLETTLRLGQLEGTWAAVYDRREKLVTKHTTLVTTVWRQSAHRLDLRPAITRYRQSLGLGETADPGNTDHRRMVASAIATTVASAIAGAAALPADQDTMITRISDALTDAEAEGYTAAVMVGAEQLGVTAPGFGLVFTDAHTALGDLGSHWADATGWLGRMVDGNATDLGNRLSALATEGAGYDEMLTAADDIIGGPDIRAVSSILDLAMGQSFSRGALALYAREGVTQVDFVTAGARVCPRCLDIESNNPWDRNAVPAPPIHIACRCSISAASPMQGLTSLLDRLATLTA